MSSRLKNVFTKKNLMFLLFLAVVIFFLLSSFVFNLQLDLDEHQSYQVNRNIIYLNLQEDGQVILDESINFTLDEATDQITLVLRNPSEGNSQLESLLYFSAESGVLNAVPIPLKDETIAQNFSYRSNPTLSETELTLSLPLAAGEHNIHLSYIWQRGCTKFDDMAVVEGPMSSLPVGSELALTEWSIQLPQSLSADEVDLVAVSLTPFKEINRSDHSIVYRSEGPLTLEDETALFMAAPRSAFSTLTDSTNSKTIPERLGEFESQLRLMHNRLRMRDVYPPVVLFFSLVSMLLWLMAVVLRRLPWRKSKHEHALEISLTAEVYLQVLMERKSDGRDILSSLLSLMTKREIVWEDEIFVWKYPDRDDFSAFSRWEAYLLQWLFNPSEDSSPVLAVQRLHRETRGLLKHREFQEHYKYFQDLVKSDFHQLNWINRTLTIFKRIAFILLGILDIIVALFFSIFARSPWPLLLLLPGTILIFNGRKQFTFSRQGYSLYRELLVYINNFSDLEQMLQNNEPELSDVETVISALPRAIIFGKIEEFFRGINALDQRSFYRAAYALLHVFRAIPLPAGSEGKQSRLAKKEELDFLKSELELMEKQLLTWDALFTITLTG